MRRCATRWLMNNMDLELVLNKVLVGDLFRLTRCASCYGINNTKGCLDCIKHTFVVLVLMFYGVTWLVATTLFQVLQKARYKIKTEYRVSEPVHGDKESVIAEIGQGNGLRPALWALISSIIIKMRKTKGHRMTLTTPISKQETSLLGFAFVDDADLVLGANDVHITGTIMIAQF